MLAPAPAHDRCFQLVLIKPSHYDDDGYVIQWARSGIPTNSLACVYALAQDAVQRQALGPDVAVAITAIDETNTRVRIKDIIANFKRDGSVGMVGLVGVQSNQFPRALDIARPLREAGIPVVIGGFHVSGCIAMLPELQADLKAALAMGCSLFAGEAEEGRLDKVMQDAMHGTLAPVYNYMKDLPALESTPTPFLPPEILKRTLDYYGSFDAGRGCPYQCSFCTISAAGTPATLFTAHWVVRRRPRLPDPVQFPHHHQRARPQVAPPFAGRYRASDPRALPQRRSLVLCDR
jgi:hypothetical protein